jgi:hypothetical protein
MKYKVGSYLKITDPSPTQQTKVYYLNIKSHRKEGNGRIVYFIDGICSYPGRKCYEIVDNRKYTERGINKLMKEKYVSIEPINVSEFNLERAKLMISDYYQVKDWFWSI